MTTDQLHRMRAGREAQLARIRDTNHAAQRAFCAWVREECLAFSERAAMAEIHGRRSREFSAADSAWRRLLLVMPVPPPDSAWERDLPAVAEVAA